MMSMVGQFPKNRNPPIERVCPHRIVWRTLNYDNAENALYWLSGLLSHRW